MVCLVWLGNETDILVIDLMIVRLVRTLRVLFSLLSGKSLSDSANVHSRPFLLLTLPVLQSFILLHRDLPPLLLEGALLILAPIQRLVVPPRQFLLRPEFILDGLVDSRPTCCSFDVDCVQVPHVSLIQGDPILEGVSLWRF